MIDLQFVGHVDRQDGTRLVVRRHVWGFSETVLERNEGGNNKNFMRSKRRWKTVSHREYRFNHDLKEPT